MAFYYVKPVTNTIVLLAGVGRWTEDAARSAWAVNHSAGDWTRAIGCAALGLGEVAGGFDLWQLRRGAAAVATPASS